MENKHKQFKPFDKVLTRLSNDVWEADFYSHWDAEEEAHNAIAYGKIPDEDIIPFEGNEHLIGTTEEPEEEIKLEEGEWIMVRDGNEFANPSGFGLVEFLDVSCGRIVDVEGYYYDFAVCFKDFDPNDMEETKKHILCVKNGKVVRYKE